MNPEQWEKLNHLFHVVIEVDESERKDFLKKVCRNDAELLNELERLLKAHEKAQDFIQTPAVSNVIEALSDKEETSNLIGQQLGVYKIIEEIGHGGMGSVYLAERADSEFEKRVAIKIVKSGMNSETTLKRFRVERQILASLEHPNIARLLDGGTIPEGLPYLVMEYVEGSPIIEFANHQRLSINQRLELFREVCSAITFAHQRLIIHRDIKASNILVTKEGVPKLLDFGIAKLIDPDGNHSILTAKGIRMMTPESASPEQIQGLQVTTLSDVYSLGVVLYELLTGQSPYKLKGYGIFEIEEVICHSEPIKPRELIKNGLRIDDLELFRDSLDQLVLKAMDKIPANRFVSAEQFSEEIRKYLEHSSDFILQIELAEAYRQIAKLQQNQGNVKLAKENYQKQIRILEAIIEAEPNNSIIKNLLITARNNI